MMALMVSNEWANGAIDEKIIMLAHYTQNGCILLALKDLFCGAFPKLNIVKIQVEFAISYRIQIVNCLGQLVKSFEIKPIFCVCLRKYAPPKKPLQSCIT